MIFMFIVHTLGRVYREIYRYVLIKRKMEWTKTHMLDKKDYFISKMISPYTKDLLNTQG